MGELCEGAGVKREKERWNNLPIVFLGLRRDFDHLEMGEFSGEVVECEVGVRIFILARVFQKFQELDVMRNICDWGRHCNMDEVCELLRAGKPDVDKQMKATSRNHGAADERTGTECIRIIPEMIYDPFVELCGETRHGGRMVFSAGLSKNLTSDFNRGEIP